MSIKYSLDFFTKRESGGKKSPLTVTLTDGNLAERLINVLNHYPFKVESDNNLRKLYFNKDYDRFESECLKRTKGSIFLLRSNCFLRVKDILLLRPHF